MDDLERRVGEFQRLGLPGQPQAMHMGSFQLVYDLWAEIKRLRALAGAVTAGESFQETRDKARGIK